ncbi:MAG: hypothetical protein A3K03_06435 [Bdellovibrionales bacterium RIFOXYD1_FULL_44_7]|nr:MAG: hypothetical protein A3K03_06435 [Bdellovibrionales bacterium RIFOXYD1_FULL_44_7]
MYQDRQQSAAKISRDNIADLKALGKLGILANCSDRVVNLEEKYAAQILQGVTHHPVAGLYHLDKYDPTGSMGFCFGRAMTAHLESLYRGICQTSIMKMWALGDLRTGDHKWRYHVTTIVKGPGKTWWAIDPIMYRVLTVEEWYKEMKAFDYDGMMKIYITAAKKFGPSTDKYHNSELLDPIFNQYFRDLLKYYRENGAVSGSRLYARMLPGKH